MSTDSFTRSGSGGLSSTSVSLTDALRPFRQRQKMLASAQLLLWLLAATIAIWLVAMWIDLVWALPITFRWWVSRVPPAVAIGLAVLYLLLRLFRREDDQVARRIDEAKQTGGEVQAGLQLASATVQPANPLTQQFAAMAVARSRDMVASFSAGDVIPTDRLRQPSLAVLAVVGIVAALTLAIPGIAKNQVKRFLTPSADIPPYTGVLLELQPEKDTVLYGENALIRATSVGGRLDRMQLITRTKSGRENVLPMLSVASSDTGSTEGQWQAMLTNVTEPLTLYARSGRSRSTRYDMGVTMTPQLLPPTIRITPPQYTRGGVYEGSIPDRGLEGLAGTEIEFTLRSNRPLASGTVAISYRDGTEQTLSLEPSVEPEALTSAVVRGSLSLSKPGQFRLSVTDIDGIDSRETIRGNITIMQDQRPVVRIASPRQVSLATPSIRLPVTVEGSDDFGITHLSLYRSLNGSPADAMELEVDGTNRQLARWTMPLADYRLESGDEIQLFARIEDNDPAGVKGAESPVTIIRIISDLEFQELSMKRKGVESLQAKYAASQRSLEQVAEALRELQEAAKQAAEAERALQANPDNDQAKQASEAAQQELRDKLLAAQQAAQDAAEAMEKFSQQAMPIDIDQELAKRLAQQSERVNELSKQLAAMTSDDSKPQKPLTQAQQKMLEAMQQQIAGQRKELQDQAIDPMEKMQQMMPLIIDQQRFAQITQQQRDLERRLNSLRSSEDASPQRVAELESQQQQLRQALDQLLDDIQSNAEALPDDPELDSLRETALEFAQAVRDSKAESSMRATQSDLLEAKFDDAHQNAETAADTLESFLSQCDGMGNKACQNCQAAFKPGAGGPKLGNSIEQMLAMMGMKPGSSGMSPGGLPGMGMGWGAGGGYAMRQPGPSNMGMYGSLPMPANRPTRGNGGQSSGGVASARPGSPGLAQPVDEGSRPIDAGSGQSYESIPGKYRNQVSEYFRQLAEQSGE